MSWGGKTVATLAFGAGCAVFGWFVRDLAGFDRKIASAPPPAAPAVAVIAAAAEPFNPPEPFVGHVEPVQEVDVLPQISGYVKEVKFAEGADVKAGDLLFEIDPEQYAAADRLRHAELEKARSEVAVAEAEADRAARYLKRMKSTDARGITQTELDQAETANAAACAKLASAKAGVAEAEANLAIAAFNLKHTKVFAPISGRIGKAFMHAGDYVAPTKGALARVVQTDPVRVTFPITDREYLAWRAERDELRVRLKLADGSLCADEGAWDFDDNEMSASTATMMVRVLFPNAARALVPNAFVTVLLDRKNPKPVVAVPAPAMVRTAKNTGVWVLDADDRAHFKAVKAGRRSEGRVVAEDLEPGSRVVFQGVHKLGEGMKTRVVDASTFK